MLIEKSRESIIKFQSLRHYAKSTMILLVTILLVGCSSRETQNANPPPISTMSTVLPPNSQIVNPTESFTAIPESTLELQYDCQPIIPPQLQNSVFVEGSIIFQGECENTQGLFKLSLKNQEFVPFHQDSTKGRSISDMFFVSTDHQWLMYENRYYDNKDTYLEALLFVTGADENSKIQYPLNGNWLSLMGWYGDNLAGFSTLRAPDFTLGLLNPFSGRVTQYFYPHNWFIREELYLDPPVARVLYFDDVETNRYVLKEIATDKILWQGMEDPTGSMFAGQPRWSPNGLFFAVPAWDGSDYRNFRFIVVSHEGKEIITNQTFQSSTKAPSIVFDWSPSGNYLVFWNNLEGIGKQLILWDVRNNQIIDTGFKTLYDPSLPVFSPDEQQFIVNVRAMMENRLEKATNYLVDMASGKSFQFDSGFVPIAWLKSSEPGRKTMKPIEEQDLLLPKSGNAVKQQCLVTPNSNEAVSEYEGGIVFFYDRHLYMLTSNKEKNKLLVDEAEPVDAFVSPDGKWLFYWYEDDNSNPHYWLVSLDGQRIEIVNSNIISSHDSIHGWFNNQELWVETKSYPGTVLFNPFENKFREPSPFRDPQMAGCTDWMICSYLGESSDFYDTGFEREVFVTASSVYMMDQDANFLWQYENWLITLNIPKWSPDQQKLGVPLPGDKEGEHYEFFTVDRNGKSEQLTHYSSVYPVLSVDKFRWSPDGRFIAFWADTRSTEGIAQRNPYRLFVLDPETRQTTDYCVAGNYSNNRAPVWSPDGNQIAVNSSRNGKRLILVADFVTGTVFEVEEGDLVGWMTNPNQ